MRTACKKMRRCSNDSCNIQLQRDSCLPAKTNDQVATRPAQLVSSRTAPSLLLVSWPPSAAFATISRVGPKVIVSGQLCRASFLSFPSPLSCQLSKAPHHLREGGEGPGESQLPLDHELLKDLSRLPPATESFPLRRFRRSSPLSSLACA